MNQDVEQVRRHFADYSQVKLSTKSLSLGHRRWPFAPALVRFSSLPVENIKREVGLDGANHRTPTTLSSTHLDWTTLLLIFSVEKSLHVECKAQEVKMHGGDLVCWEAALASVHRRLFAGFARCRTFPHHI